MIGKKETGTGPASFFQVKRRIMNGGYSCQTPASFRF